MWTKKNFVTASWREEREEELKLALGLEKLQIDPRKQTQTADTKGPEGVTAVDSLKESKIIRQPEAAEKSPRTGKTEVSAKPILGSEDTSRLESNSGLIGSLESENLTHQSTRSKCSWQPPSPGLKDRWLSKQKKRSPISSSPTAAESSKEPGDMVLPSGSTAIFEQACPTLEILPGLPGGFGTTSNGTTSQASKVEAFYTASLQLGAKNAHPKQYTPRQFNDEASSRSQTKQISPRSRPKHGEAKLRSFYVQQDRESCRRSSRIKSRPQPSEAEPHPTQELWDHLNSLEAQNVFSVSLEVSPDPSMELTLSPTPEASGQIANDKKALEDGIPQAKPSKREAPVPTSQYIEQAKQTVRVGRKPQRLLVVLDLNGTLLERKRNHHGNRKSSHVFATRPHLAEFLQYCLENHSVMIWSSARPANVDVMCRKIFSEPDLKMLVGTWGRDKLGLSPADYNEKVQVYKRLEMIWTDKHIQSQHPDPTAIWSQANTVLVDDSVLKGSSQPYNLIEVPEYYKNNLLHEARDQPLLRVIEYIEQARRSVDVSAYMQKHPFRAGKVEDARSPPAPENPLKGPKTGLN